MIDDDLHDDGEDVEPGTIGVGMGGSCPVCRAPVDLGQEFCLECGSPIRFTPRQRKQQRGASRPVAGAAPIAPPKKSGFPWVPFLVVLALVGAGVAFALVEGGKENTSGKDKDNGTEPALPTITNDPPETTTSSTETTTLQDCDPSQPLGDTEPAVVDDPTLGESGSEQIPSLSPDGTDPTDPSDGFSDVPSIEPTDSGSETVTVDQNGNLCADQGSSDTSTDPSTSPTDPTSTTPTTSPTDTTSTTTPTTTGATASGDWPSGKEGWTVIVAGYPTEERATQRAADVQEDGFSDSGVLFSTDFQSLCPGIHVVFSGVFDTERQADDRLDDLAAKPDYAGMYVREIKTSGSRPSSCQQVRTQN